MRPRPIKRAERKRRRWDYVFRKRDRCPACESSQLHTYRSQKNGDDLSITRWMQCTNCSHKFLLVLE